jgi:hypothetical protein
LGVVVVAVGTRSDLVVVVVVAPRVAGTVGTLELATAAGRGPAPVGRVAIPALRVVADVIADLEQAPVTS